MTHGNLPSQQTTTPEGALEQGAQQPSRVRDSSHMSFSPGPKAKVAKETSHQSVTAAGSRTTSSDPRTPTSGMSTGTSTPLIDASGHRTDAAPAVQVSHVLTDAAHATASQLSTVMLSPTHHTQQQISAESPSSQPPNQRAIDHGGFDALGGLGSLPIYPPPGCSPQELWRRQMRRDGSPAHLKPGMSQPKGSGVGTPLGFDGSSPSAAAGGAQALTLGAGEGGSLPTPLPLSASSFTRSTGGGMPSIRRAILMQQDPENSAGFGQSQLPLDAAQQLTSRQKLADISLPWSSNSRLLSVDVVYTSNGCLYFGLGQAIYEMPYFQSSQRRGVRKLADAGTRLLSMGLRTAESVAAEKAAAGGDKGSESGRPLSGQQHQTPGVLRTFQNICSAREDQLLYAVMQEMENNDQQRSYICAITLDGHLSLVVPPVDGALINGMCVTNSGAVVVSLDVEWRHEDDGDIIPIYVLGTKNGGSSAEAAGCWHQVSIGGECLQSMLSSPVFGNSVGIDADASKSTSKSRRPLIFACEDNFDDDSLLLTIYDKHDYTPSLCRAVVTLPSELSSSKVDQFPVGLNASGRGQTAQLHSCEVAVSSDELRKLGPKRKWQKFRLSHSGGSAGYFDIFGACDDDRSGMEVVTRLQRRSTLTGVALSWALKQQHSWQHGKKTRSPEAVFEASGQAGASSTDKHSTAQLPTHSGATGATGATGYSAWTAAGGAALGGDAGSRGSPSVGGGISLVSFSEGGVTLDKSDAEACTLDETFVTRTDPGFWCISGGRCFSSEESRRRDNRPTLQVYVQDIPELPVRELGFTFPNHTLTDTTFVDMQVKSSDGDLFAAHRFVIGSRSDVLRQMIIEAQSGSVGRSPPVGSPTKRRFAEQKDASLLGGGTGDVMQTHPTKEALSAISLPASSATIHVLLGYLYSEQLKIASMENKGSVLSELLYVADVIGMPILRRKVEDMLVRHIDIQNVLHIYKHLHRLKNMHGAQRKYQTIQHHAADVIAHYMSDLPVHKCTPQLHGSDTEKAGKEVEERSSPESANRGCIDLERLLQDDVEAAKHLRHALYCRYESRHEVRKLMRRFVDQWLQDLHSESDSPAALKRELTRTLLELRIKDHLREKHMLSTSLN